jgi:hypothetical protein
VLLVKRAKLTASTPMTPELFTQWKTKKAEEREAGLAAKRAERAKNDRMRYVLNSSFILHYDIVRCLCLIDTTYNSHQWPGAVPL